MKKGISIWSFAGGNLRDCFQLAKKAGYDGVEVALAEEGEISLSSTREDILEVRRQADEAGIQLYSVASGLYWTYSLTSNDKQTREKAEAIVRKQLDIASWLGCDTILVIPGGVGMNVGDSTEIVPYDIAYERSLSALKRLAPYAESVNVSIGLENVWNKFLLSPLEMRDFIDSINSEYVGAYFDVGNVLYSGYPEQWIDILNKRILKVHFKDYRISCGGLDGFVDLLAGDVDYPAVMNAFQRVGYDGWVTGEMLPPYKHFPEALLYTTSIAMNHILGRKSQC